MKARGSSYIDKKEIIEYHATWNYIGNIIVTEDINNFKEEKANFWLNEMCSYFDLEDLTYGDA